MLTVAGIGSIMRKTLVAALVLVVPLSFMWQPVISAQEAADLAELVETRDKVPRLKAAAAFVPQDDLITIELSEYAGYSGLIVANGGLEPNDESYFTKKHGFRLEITLSEEESWSKLNSGGMAGSATTVDVLAAYGGQFKVTVPALIGFSRGSTGIVVRKEIGEINDLRGKVVPTAQFTETDFFIRYLAQEAGLGIQLLQDPPWKADADKLNLVFCDEGFAAGDIFARDVKKKLGRFAGCVTWDPKTKEVVEDCEGEAIILATTANLLVVADVLILNEGFAKSNPKIVEGLVDGLLVGNDMVRRDPGKHAAVIEKALGWEAGEAVEELKRVHLANLPENLSFFNGTIDSAGSFGYLFETAVELYRSQLGAKPVAYESLASIDALTTAQASGAFKDQVAEIKPIQLAADLGETSVRDQAASLLSKDVRIEFEPNSAEVMLDHEPNKQALESVAKLLRISPGSTILLRGHADSAKLDAFRARPDFEAAGGEAKLRAGRLNLKDLSKKRCLATKELLIKQHGIAEPRISYEGVGVDSPTGRGPEFDRRVEVKWFTKE